MCLMWSNSIGTPSGASHLRSHRRSLLQFLLRCSRWQQNNATFPVEPSSHNKRRKRKNDSSGSSSTALRDNTGIGFRLRVFNIFFVFYFVASSGAESDTAFSRCLSACSPSCSPLFADGCKDTRNMPMEACLTKMAGRSEM